jgi:7,8-dihydropterin-6-yl-methyl-4-(beta-D-ribofuranosyl)aminobenzene 5'-phosphate synthase
MAKPASLTVLSDNHCTCRPFKAEHGLSLLVETPGANILFDTGASNLFSENASALKLELFGVDSIVLSHGHFDHGDGIRKALAESPNAHLVLQREALAPKMSCDIERRMFNVGLSPRTVKSIKAAEAEGRATFIEGPVKLGPNIIVFPIGPRNATPEDWPYHIQTADGDFEPDRFQDELCMLALGEKSATLVLGDSHCGIIKAYKRASELAKGLPVTMIVGGSCLNETSFQTLQAIANFLLKTGARICLGHATGLDGYGTLHRLLGSKVIPMRVGLRLDLDI